ncbi:MAG: hypothetical protein PHG71_05245 [Kiritimatiellae bacterium]|nr:hypothetical protein [Kiritimatiellia bacterium]
MMFALALGLLMLVSMWHGRVTGRGNSFVCGICVLLGKQTGCP